MTETITVNRGATNARGARETSSTHTIQGLFAWGQSGRSSGRYRANFSGQESATITAQLLVQRGTDLQARDRIMRTNGEGYAVVGNALWGEDFPLEDGYDSHLDDWVVFQVVSTTG